MANATTTNGNNAQKIKGVWSIVENPSAERPVWVRMGTAFVNRDMSLNVYLDGYPANAKLHIRDLEVTTKKKSA